MRLFEAEFSRTICKNHAARTVVDFPEDLAVSAQCCSHDNTSHGLTEYETKREVHEMLAVSWPELLGCHEVAAGLNVFVSLFVCLNVVLMLLSSWQYKR